MVGPVPVREVMVHDVVTLSSEAGVTEAVERIRTHGIGSVVVEAAGEIVVETTGEASNRTEPTETATPDGT
ncbi:MAG: CBS domain-containing protein [Haloglomus sp.]